MFVRYVESYSACFVLFCSVLLEIRLRDVNCDRHLTYLTGWLPTELSSSSGLSSRIRKHSISLSHVDAYPYRSKHHDVAGISANDGCSILLWLLSS